MMNLQEFYYNTIQAIAITDGTVFYDHVDEDFLQHIPDLDS